MNNPERDFRLHTLLEMTCAASQQIMRFWEEFSYFGVLVTVLGVIFTQQSWFLPKWYPWPLKAELEVIVVLQVLRPRKVPLCIRKYRSGKISS